MIYGMRPFKRNLLCRRDGNVIMKMSKKLNKAFYSREEYIYIHLPWRYSYSIQTFTYIPYDIYSLKDSKEDFQLNYLNFGSTNILLYLAINFHEKSLFPLYYL